MLLTVLFVLCFFANCNCQLDAVQQAEQKLLVNITTGYRKEVRPEQTVTVTVTTSFKQIISIDEKNQIMTSSCYVSQLWHDPRLTWDPALFQDIKVMMIPAKNIWVPDLFIINTADTDGYFKLNSDFSLITIDYTGSVYLILPVVALKTRCTLYTRSFPFDSQVCKITFGSWNQGSNRIALSETETEANTDDYTENPIWTLVATNVTASRAPDRVPFEETENINVNIEVYLKRKPLYFMMNGVFACLILNCITLLLYCLPFPMQQGLSMTGFMTFSVYSLSFSNSTPTQSDFMPLITLYFVLSISFSLSSMLWFVVCNHFTTTQKVPKWLLTFCGFLQRIFFCCFENPGKDNIWLYACNKCSKRSVVPKETISKVEEINEKDKKEGTKAEIGTTMTNNSNGFKTDQTKAKCNFCDRCVECQKDFDKDKDKGKTKKDVESKMSALNYFVFILAFIYILTFQLVIWLSLS